MSDVEKSSNHRDPVQRVARKYDMQYGEAYNAILYGERLLAEAGPHILKYSLKSLTTKPFHSNRDLYIINLLKAHLEGY